MKTITAGKPYIDIDAYACMVAYAELLNLQGTPARAVSTATLNQSITPKLSDLPVNFESQYSLDDSDEFILVDVSNPEYFDEFVDLRRVVEVIDHHPGDEQYWSSRIDVAQIIEPVGAACTFIVEKWVKAGLLDKMSVFSAQLLAAGILDNTLNFKAKITTQRDKEAYDQVAALVSLDDDWVSQYFMDCQSGILKNLAGSIVNDTKIMSFTGLSNKRVAFGQIVIWNADEVVKKRIDEIKKTMNQTALPWFVNVIDIYKGNSLLVCSDDAIKKWAGSLLGAQFNGEIAKLSRLWLRKEMKKADLLSAEA
jgi:inorganic pyrophosphatase/manganese-dependent inorganic pyrophosphatase